MSTRTTLLLSLAVLLVAAPAALGASGAYVGGTGDAILSCALRDAGHTDFCVGGHIFDVPDTAGNASIAIEDKVTDTTGGYYQFLGNETTETGQPKVLSSGPFCDTTTQTVPDNATNLSVYVDEGFSILDCGTGQQPAFATQGTIEVSWQD